MQNKITSCLWYEKDLSNVIEYYKNVFNGNGQENLKLIYLGDLQNGPGGEYQFGTIEIFGKKYDMLAAGPMFKFNESISLTINTEDQAETDYYWDYFTQNGGAESMCGWCKDAYGLSWQIIPKRLQELMTEKDTEKRNYAMQQMFQMKKIIIKDLVKIP